jgi:hypothetical protein
MEEQSIHRILKESELKMRDQLAQRNSKISNDLLELDLFDSAIVTCIGDVISHILSTFKDKYETGIPDIDLYNLMRSSQNGKGFNIGNSTKYNKRYLTTGFNKSGNVEDLYKSIHYLLMEIDRGKNEG